MTAMRGMVSDSGPPVSCPKPASAAVALVEKVRSRPPRGCSRRRYWDHRPVRPSLPERRARRRLPVRGLRWRRRRHRAVASARREAVTACPAQPRFIARWQTAPASSGRRLALRQSGLALGVGLGQPAEERRRAEPRPGGRRGRCPSRGVIDAGQDAHLADVAQAITASSNAAGTSLWTSLGPRRPPRGRRRCCGPPGTREPGKAPWRLHAACGRRLALSDQAGSPPACRDGRGRRCLTEGQVVDGQQRGLGATGSEAHQRRRGAGSPGARAATGASALVSSAAPGSRWRLDVHRRPTADESVTAQPDRVARWPVARRSTARQPAAPNC